MHVFNNATGAAPVALLKTCILRHKITLSLHIFIVLKFKLFVTYDVVFTVNVLCSEMAD